MKDQTLTTSVQPSPEPAPPAPNLANTLWQYKHIGFLLGLLVVMQFFNRQLEKGKPGQFTTGRFANKRETKTAERLLKQQHAGERAHGCAEGRSD